MIRKMMANLLLSFTVAVPLTPALADTTPVAVPLIQQSSGSLIVKAAINGSAESDFLVDTGSGLLVINRELFKRIEAADRGGRLLRPVGRVAARMADGRYRKLQTYRAENFRIGSCEIGDVRLAVVPGADRNILGLNALVKAAPFTVSLEPPSLHLAKCGLPELSADGALAAIP